MKNGNKVIALIVSLCMLLGIVPVYTLMAEPSYKTETDEEYTNNFNVDGNLSLLAEDFSFWHDTKDSNQNSLKNLTSESDISGFLNISNNRLERVFNSSAELAAGSDGNRPY